MNRGNPPKILVRGVGEIASAVAHRLSRSGADVVLQTSRLPLAIRRLQAFSDAVFDGLSALEGVTARRITDPGTMPTVLADGEIPLLYCDFSAALSAARWDVLVDARMNKHLIPEPQIGLAPLVIGMGPGCTVGANVNVGIETSWDALGEIVRIGSTMPLRGEPRAVLGHARDRFRYAPKAGTIRAEAEIGQQLRRGDVVAWIDDIPVVTAFDGVVRGVTHDGVAVEAGNKIAEIDPRIGTVRLSGIDERPHRIAEAVSIIVGECFPAMVFVAEAEA